MKSSTLFDALRLRPVSRRPRASRHLLAASLILAAGAAGCSGGGPSGPPIGGHFQSAVIVRGNVQDSQGHEIFGTTVRVTVYDYDGSCSAEPVTDPFDVTVDEIGDYYVLATFDRSGFQACLEVQALPPGGSGYQSALHNFYDVDVNEAGDIIYQQTYDFVLQDL
jgi:hypothetical protein